MNMELSPDLITMDIQMPRMNGLEAIEQIMAQSPVPILVLTSASDANTAYEAIAKGALEVVPKPDCSEDSREFIRKIKMLSQIRVIPHIRRGGSKHNDVENKGILLPKFRQSERIVAIASSTGGPKALSVFLSGLPLNFPAPIVIAQHIAENFIEGLNEWLNSISKLEVITPGDGEPLKAGKVYLSPPEKNMIVSPGRRVRLRRPSPSDFYFPSCNALLSSAAASYGADAIGIILTGMGDDGVRGIGAIKEAGGITIAQDEKSSVVFGMPRVAIESGHIDYILPVRNISFEILRILNVRALKRH